LSPPVTYCNKFILCYNPARTQGKRESTIWPKGPSMDEKIFLFLNVKLYSRYLDNIMLLASDSGIFFLLFMAFLFSGLTWLHKKKIFPVIRLCLVFMTIFFVCDRGLKQTIKRTRPEHALAGARVQRRLPDGTEKFLIAQQPTPSSRRNSFPSSHAAYAFALATFFWLIQRRGAYVYFPVAALVAYSRVYLAKHYPSDVAVGVLLGVATAYFYYWIERPMQKPATRRKVPLLGPIFDYRSRLGPSQLKYLRLAFLVIIGLIIARLQFIRAEVYDLAPDEAYYWNWSRHLSYGYFSKGPGIAFLIRFFTTVFDNEPYAVRLGALTCSLFMGLLVYVFSLKVFRSEKTAFYTVLAVFTVPLFSAGAVIMTIDPPFSLFYALCIYAIYKSCIKKSKTWWYAGGLFLGLGILFKYTMMLAIPAIFIFLILSRNQRNLLKRKEPYLFVLIGLLFSLPMLIWNYKNAWPTLGLLSWEAGITRETAAVSFKTFLDFFISQFFLISPFYFIFMVYGFYLAIKEYRKESKDEYLLLLCSSALVIACFFLKSLSSRMQANWLAFTYTPAAILAIGMIAKKYSETKGQRERRSLKVLFAISFVFASAITLSSFCLNGLYYLPWKMENTRIDPAYHLRGWKKLGREVSEIFYSRMGGPQKAFIFSHNYQIASELAIYVKPRTKVYCADWGRIKNQFDFWPGYEKKPAGTDALYVNTEEWWHPAIYEEFTKVKLIKKVPVKINRRLIRTFYIYRCYGFKGKAHKDKETVPEVPDMS